MRAPRRSTGSTRLIAALGIAISLGVVAFLLTRDTTAGPLRPREPVSVVDPKPQAAELPDLGPVAAVRATGGSVTALEKDALDHVLGIVASGTLPRNAGEPISLEAAAALDPKVAAGRLVEVAGIVRSLDKEAYESKANPGWDQLWSFELASDAASPTGAHVVIVAPGDSKRLGGGVPTSSHMEGTTGEPLKNGNRVRVRGVVLQRRTGAVGGIPSLAQPTVVLVGREYRITGDVKPAPTRLADIPLAAIVDRNAEQTYDAADEAHWALLAWARARGPVALAADLTSGATPVLPWGSNQFLNWKRDLEADKGQDPDPRKWTLERRGRAFALLGHLGDVVSEDWPQVPQNAYDVDRRHVYWLISDAYANVGIPIYAPYGLEAFPSVRVPKPESRPRVRVFALYTRNLTYALKRPASQEITVPMFHLLYIEKQ